MSNSERLDKVLSNLGYGSRTEIKRDISKGKVMVNGNICKDPSTKISFSDTIQHYDEVLIRKEHYYFMMNKAPDCITATEDPREKTVMDYLNERHKNMNLFPVGRLDKETEGLLIFTTNGKFAHHYTSPKHLIDKEYYVEVEGILSDSDVQAFREGVILDDGYKTLPGKLILFGQKDESSPTQGSDLIKEDLVIKEKKDLQQTSINLLNLDQDINILINSSKISYAKVIIREGKYRQIRRMFQALGKHVIYLRREKMGTVVLDPNLQVGSYRELTEVEVEELISG
ncbi:MAG: 16S rRNA pseudouridine(516) synthase [Leptospira sp.]|nr:MAG: 16S rRNA pseudouridine(516) synthase [Leptospira sp.]